MGPNKVNGIVGGDHAHPMPPSNAPMLQGQIQTADFQASGNLLLLYRHLKDMYDPPVESTSGPIKPLSQEEKQLDQNKPQADLIRDLPETILGK
jgi:hypothetical protein